jgi:hypothetical protein
MKGGETTVEERDWETVTGVAWYRREQWPLLRKKAADPEILEKTYEEWVGMAQKAVLDLAREGVRTERVDIDVEELITWCRSVNRPLDSNARAEFTSRKLRHKHEAIGEDTV